MEIIGALYHELAERGWGPLWFDDNPAFVIDDRYHIWTKGTWLYYWYEKQNTGELFPDPTTNRIDLNDPAFIDLLETALHDLRLNSALANKVPTQFAA